MKCENPNCVNGKDFSKGTFNTDDGWSGVTDCPYCNGTGTKPEPEQEPEQKRFPTIGIVGSGMSKSVIRRLAVQKPEPEQDERIREAYKIYKNLSIEQASYEEFKSIYESGQNSRNAEIEVLKAEIESMRGCVEEVIEEYPDAFAAAMMHLKTKWQRLDKEN